MTYVFEWMAYSLGGSIFWIPAVVLGYLFGKRNGAVIIAGIVSVLTHIGTYSGVLSAAKGGLSQNDSIEIISVVSIWTAGTYFLFYAFKDQLTSFVAETFGNLSERVTAIAFFALLLTTDFIARVLNYFAFSDYREGLAVANILGLFFWIFLIFVGLKAYIYWLEGRSSSGASSDTESQTLELTSIWKGKQVPSTHFVYDGQVIPKPKEFEADKADEALPLPASYNQEAEQLKPLIFSEDELSVYGDEQLVKLYEVLKEDMLNTLKSVCESVCKKIGREPYKGNPRDFLRAYYLQLHKYLSA